MPASLRAEARPPAISPDPTGRGGDSHPAGPPAPGLAAARMLAMLSYRHWSEYAQRFGRLCDETGQFQVANYLRYQGNKLVRRFDAASYVTLTRAMDCFDLGHERGRLKDVLAAIRIPVLVVGINSDVLYPLSEQQELAQYLPNAELEVLDSPRGHDAFLIDTAQLDALLNNVRLRQQRRLPRTQCATEVATCNL